jgi:hypothetical protein
MDAPAWKGKINTALDPGAVVQVVQDFLHSLNSAELDTLPPGTRPASIRTPADISNWAFNLSAAWLANGPKANGILGDVSLVFAEAARRLSHVTPRVAVTGWDKGGLEDEDSDDSGTWVLVYDYEYWDPRKETMVRAQHSATLEAIKNGLGQPILPSGRKVRLAQLDRSGRVPTFREPDTAGDRTAD